MNITYAEERIIKEALDNVLNNIINVGGLFDEHPNCRLNVNETICLYDLHFEDIILEIKKIPFPLEKIEIDVCGWAQKKQTGANSLPHPYYMQTITILKTSKRFEVKINSF